MKVPALLKNKYVCYALMALAALNVIGYVTVKAWECLALFALAGYSAHCYCNNVSLAILAALFVANFVFGCGRVKEGFEDAMKGPVEKMTEAADLLEGAANDCADKAQADCTGSCEWDDAASECKAAAQQAAFAASQASCCDGANWKGGLSQDETNACQALGDEATVCAPATPPPSNP